MEREEFGVRLRRLREARALSIREVARRTGISHPSLVLIEQGKRWYSKLPPLDDLRALAKALDMTVDELAGPEEPGEPPIIPVPIEPLSVVLARIGAHPLEEEPPIELDQPVAAGRRGKGIVQGIDDAGRRRRTHRHALYLLCDHCHC